jgi:hypothetical protein
MTRVVSAYPSEIDLKFRETNAPSIMIGEKAADLIGAERT